MSADLDAADNPHEQLRPHASGVRGAQHAGFALVGVRGRPPRGINERG
jgi:hypothetical protein